MGHGRSKREQQVERDEAVATDDPQDLPEILWTSPWGSSATQARVNHSWCISFMEKLAQHNTEYERSPGCSSDIFLPGFLQFHVMFQDALSPAAGGWLWAKLLGFPVLSVCLR